METSPVRSQRAAILGNNAAVRMLSARPGELFLFRQMLYYRSKSAAGSAHSASHTGIQFTERLF